MRRLGKNAEPPRTALPYRLVATTRTISNASTRLTLVMPNSLRCCEAVYAPPLAVLLAPVGRSAS